MLAGYAWWAPLVLGPAWGGTHWLLRESGVWKDRNTDEVNLARQRATYSYDLAVEPAPAKEVRLFGLAGWTVDRFAGQRRHLFDLQYAATRLRERSVLRRAGDGAGRQRARVLVAGRPGRPRARCRWARW